MASRWAVLFFGVKHIQSHDDEFIAQNMLRKRLYDRVSDIIYLVIFIRVLCVLMEQVNIVYV
jgi:hypothetical protein